MQSNFCDSLSVSCSPSDSTGDAPQRTCTTQSPLDSSNYPNVGGYYSPSPSLGFAETVQPAQRSHLPDTLRTATQTYSALHPSGSAPVMWPTPPSTACEDFDDYTYHASPTSGSFGAPGYASSARSPVDSPRSWPSPETQHLTYEQAIWRNQEPTPLYSMHIALTMHGDDLHQHQQQQMLNSPYTNATFPTDHLNPGSMATEAPGMTPYHVDAALSDRSVSPQPKPELSNVYTFGGDDAAPLLGQGGNTSDGDDASKADEPYAQLIFKAFMSRENHAMTLQEIYQWFRDNTDKSDKENKGWQNSIRHNLSMNGAFVKIKSGATSPPTDAGEPRRSTEWFLEDWAAEGGVYSTTRYRKNNPRGRGGSNLSRSNHNHHPSARALSGRKGGITTSRTRPAATRAALRRQQMGEMLASHLPDNGYQGSQSFYSRHSSMDFTGSVRGDPATPPEVPAGSILFEDTMHRPQAVESGTSHGYYYGPGHPHYSDLRQPLPHSAPGPPAYRLEDVTSVYEPLPMTQPSGQNDSSQLPAHLLFTDDMGESSTAGSSHVGNMAYGWGEGGVYRG